MRPEEAQRIASVLGSAVVDSRTLAGGYSHETCLLTLADGLVVARFGGADPVIEAAVMAVAGRLVPVPDVLQVLPDDSDHARPTMVVSYVSGTPLSDVLADGGYPANDLVALGREVGRVVARISTVGFDRPGFFADRRLAVREEAPWSVQLPELAARCMATTPDARLDAATRTAWVELCTAHAPALRRVDAQARLVHADLNPKNLLVTRTPEGWRVDAVLDWEFSYSGCPYGDAANMARFGADYPRGFLDGFRAGYATGQPADRPLVDDWPYVGRVLDMFALSDLATRPLGHAVADQAARQIEQWISDGVPDAP